MAEKKVRYEYMSETPFVGGKGNTIGTLLNSHTTAGWEFMFAINTGGNVYFIYRREIED